MSKNCGVCGKPIDSGIVVEAECLKKLTLQGCAAVAEDSIVFCTAESSNVGISVLCVAVPEAEYERLKQDSAKLKEYERLLDEGQLVRVVKCAECKWTSWCCKAGREKGYCSEGSKKD